MLTHTPAEGWIAPDGAWFEIAPLGGIKLQAVQTDRILGRSLLTPGCRSSRSVLVMVRSSRVVDDRGPQKLPSENISDVALWQRAKWGPCAKHGSESGGNPRFL